MRLLKTNTAIRISVGPFVDYEDGTPEIALTVTNTTCEMYITPNDGGAVTRTAITLTASGGSNDMAHITDDVGGYYDLELTQLQTNFLGRMRLAFTDADVHMSLWEDFLVVTANVFNTLATGTDYLDAAVVEQANIDFGTTQKASINTEADTALSDIKLDHLVAVADSNDPVDNSIIAKLVSKDATADWSDYDNTTDSLEANRDNLGTAGAVIATSIWAKIIDGTITFEKFGKILLAVKAGRYAISGTTITYYDQSNALILTDAIGELGGTPVI